MKDYRFKEHIKLTKKVVCAEFQVTESEMMSKSRKREFVQARQITWSILRELSKNSISFAILGEEIGNKDHATVLFGIRTVNNLLSYDQQFISKYEEVKGIVKEKIKENKALQQVPSKDESKRQKLIKELSEVLKSQSGIHMRIGIRSVIQSLRVSVAVI